jgi:hypothetical protein
VPVVIVKVSIGCGCLSSAKGCIDRLHSHNSIDSINYAHILVDQGSLKYKRNVKKNCELFSYYYYYYYYEKQKKKMQYEQIEKQN